MGDYHLDYEPIVKLMASDKMTYAVFAGQTNQPRILASLINDWWGDCLEMKLSSEMYELGIRVLSTAYHNTPSQDARS
tara:strand:+ start:154 stop:387 length:234 start_codon:yes stop_codon:yes gene_type:complete